jgi:DNA segregation ATPase FtsK/SpoIIIE, S-DNA-T family
MQSPSLVEAPNRLLPDHDWVHWTRLRVRGLEHRWQQLLHAYSAGVSQLQAESSEACRAYEEMLRSVQALHSAELHESITTWDSQLDDALCAAEGKTLANLLEERDELARLQRQHKAGRTTELSSFEQSKSNLRKRMENAKQQATKVRDSARTKIDREHHGLDQRMHEAREWIGLKSGNPILVNWTSHAVPDKANEITNLATLDAVARDFERIKQKMIVDLDRLQRHPSLRLMNYPLLTGLGLLAGSASAWTAFVMKSPPLIWAVIGLSAAIIVPALVALAASPILTKTLKRLFPAIVDLEKEAHFVLEHGRRLIDQHHAIELTNLESEGNKEYKLLESQHRTRLQNIEDEYQRDKRSVIEQSRSVREQIAASRRVHMGSIEDQGKVSIDALKKQQSDQLADIDNQQSERLSRLRRDFEQSQHRTSDRWARGVQTLIERVAEQNANLESKYPSWGSEEMRSGTWERSSEKLAWPIGSFRYSIPCNETPQSGQLRPFVSRLESIEPVPVMYDLLHHGNLILAADAGAQKDAHAIASQVLLRAITSLPAGVLQVTVIDPEGLGKRFSWMMHLADVDPQLVNHRVWTQPVHIADQLELAARHVEDVIQQSLRNQYRNLADYNAKAGPMAIPYRLIVWSGFPLGLDEHSWQSLLSIMASGARCGVGVLLQLADNCKWPAFVDPRKVREHGLVLDMRGDPSVVQLQDAILGNRELSPIEPPVGADLQRIMEHQLNAARSIGKRIVPFSSIAPIESQRYAQSSSDGLDIPIGVSDSGRPQSLRLGTGTAQHVLIAGKTGSGKSSLLHTLITSGALRYSPDELRMVLLDFKKGVEFQIYAQCELPHADVIGIESRREFGLSTLEYLDRILSARGEAFRQWGVQDLPSLKQKHPAIKLPRILIIIDEFQELFVEDDKLSQQASLLMDRLVRQGRSFGLHLVLASQTLGGAYSLPRTTLAQMAVRIALQCDSSDAMLILSEDNTAAERLRHSGQGIYNETGGRIEGNHNFQVSFLEKLEQWELLRSLPVSDCQPMATINPLGRRVIFEGHKPSHWESASARSAMSALSPSQRLQAPWILGDSVSIEPPVVRSFVPSAGRNAMIVGNDSSMVASLWAGWFRGLHEMPFADGDPQPRFWILDGSTTEDVDMARTIQWALQNTGLVRAGSVRDLDVIVSEIQAEWDRRLTQPDAKYPPGVLMIGNLSRFREFRRNDDFSFSSSGEEVKPDAFLVKLLSDGPQVGLHVCVWADSTSTLGRWLPRNALRDIELRILMQMSSADSNQLIDSSNANRLDRYIMLLHDDADGKSVKFRPFALESILMAAPVR